MTALTPQFVLLTTGVGALMILVGLRRGPLRARSFAGEGDGRRFGFRYGVVSVPVF